MARKILTTHAQRMVRRDGTMWQFMADRFDADTACLVARRWTGHRWVTVHTIWLTSPIAE